MFKKVHLPLSHAQRLRGVMEQFTQARDDLTELQLEISEEITEKEAALQVLKLDLENTTDALARIKTITC